MWLKEAMEDALPDFIANDLPEIAVAEIEKMLRAERFSNSPPPATREFEKKRAIPMMTISFHKHIFTHMLPPTPEEYWEEYHAENSHYLSPVSDEDMGAVRHRVMRAYPSLIRDVHFVCVARELGCPVIHSVEDDIAGIDARVPTENGEKMVRLYYDSYNSRKHRVSKAFCHEMSANHFDFGLKPEHSLRVGDFLLYRPRDIRQFLLELGVEEGKLSAIK